MPLVGQQLHYNTPGACLAFSLRLNAKSAHPKGRFLELISLKALGNVGQAHIGLCDDAFRDHDMLNDGNLTQPPALSTPCSGLARASLPTIIKMQQQHAAGGHFSIRCCSSCPIDWPSPRITFSLAMQQKNSTGLQATLSQALMQTAQRRS